MWHNDKYQCDCKNPKQNCVCEKDYIWDFSKCSCRNDEYLASIIEDSVIICDETKTNRYVGR